MSSFRPHFPGSLFARPKLIQILVFAVSVHGEEKSIMAIGHELSFARQTLQRFTFEDALRASQVIEHAPVEDEEACADQSVAFGLCHEALNPTLGVGFEHSEARDRRNRRNRGKTSMLAMKVEQATDIHIAQAIAIGQQKRIVILEIASNAL